MQQAPGITDEKIRFALVGCGRISSNHIEALTSYSSEAELVALCDIDKTAVSVAAEKTGARSFHSCEELLRFNDFEVAILATPSGLHSAQSILFAQSGKNVITEKPMATRWKDGLRMVQACDDAGVKLFVVKQNRLNPTVQRVKAAIEAGRFGRIFMVAVNVFWARPQSYYDSADWRGTWEFDGGAFMNQASHYVDLLDWLIGPVESVQAFTATLARNIEVEDTGTVSLRWRNGALGSMNVTMLTYPKNLEGSITILGEKGTVRLGGVAVNELQHWEFADKSSSDEDVASANYGTTSVYGFGHRRYYQNIIDALRGRAEAQTDGREGLRSLELLIAIYLSARDGRRVALPLNY